MAPTKFTLHLTVLSGKYRVYDALGSYADRSRPIAEFEAQAIGAVEVFISGFEVNVPLTRKQALRLKRLIMRHFKYHGFSVLRWDRRGKPKAVNL